MGEADTLERDLDRWQNEGGRLAGRASVTRTSVPRTPARSVPRLARALRISRKIGVAVAGGSLLVLGVALIFLPGPAIVVIPLGLALLGTEFRWAARLLRSLRERMARVVARARGTLPARSHI